MGGELPLHGSAALELVAGSDDPEADDGAAAAGDPAMDGVVLVVHGVLVLVIHLALELRLLRVHQQHGLLVGQRRATWLVPVRRARHVPLYVV